MCTCREYKEPYRPPSRRGAARRRVLLAGRPEPGPTPNSPKQPEETPRGGTSLARPARPR